MRHGQLRGQLRGQPLLCWFLGSLRAPDFGQEAKGRQVRVHCGVWWDPEKHAFGGRRLGSPLLLHHLSERCTSFLCYLDFPMSYEYGLYSDCSSLLSLTSVPSTDSFLPVPFPESWLFLSCDPFNLCKVPEWPLCWNYQLNYQLKCVWQGYCRKGKTCQVCSLRNLYNLKVSNRQRGGE